MSDLPSMMLHPITNERVLLVPEDDFKEFLELKSTLTATKERLRQSDAMCVVMRNILERAINQVFSEMTSFNSENRAAWIWRDAEQAISGDLGKSLLAELEQCKARLSEQDAVLKWASENVWNVCECFGHWTIRTRIGGMFNSHCFYEALHAAWLAEGQQENDDKHIH